MQILLELNSATETVNTTWATGVEAASNHREAECSRNRWTTVVVVVQICDPRVMKPPTLHENVVEHVQKQIIIKEADVKAKTLICAESTRRFELESMSLEEMQQKLRMAVDTVEISRQEIAHIEIKLRTAWELAQPIQIEAQLQLEKISKKDVTEMKSFKSPHPLVLTVMKVVLLLFNSVHIELHPSARTLPATLAVMKNNMDSKTGTNLQRNGHHSWPWS